MSNQTLTLALDALPNETRWLPANVRIAYTVDLAAAVKAARAQAFDEVRAKMIQLETEYDSLKKHDHAAAYFEAAKWASRMHIQTLWPVTNKKPGT